jgi:hypothetical protein
MAFKENWRNWRRWHRCFQSVPLSVHVMLEILSQVLLSESFIYCGLRIGFADDEIRSVFYESTSRGSDFDLI